MADKLTATEDLLALMEAAPAWAAVNTLRQDGLMEVALLSAAISLKRIADLLEVTRAEDGKVITLPQILLRLVQAVEPTNQSGMNSITECLFGMMLNGRN